MSFEQPTLAVIVSRIAGDIEAQLAGADAHLRRNVLAVLGRALAGAAHGLYGHQDWIAAQVFPDTAEVENLERWATIWGLARKSAVAATGDADFTGTDDTVIPAGTVLARSDGALFTTDADATIADGAASAAVTASAAGSDGNTGAGVGLTIVTAIAGVDSAAIVGDEDLAGGADTETDAELLGRLLARIQQPPGGGTAADYVRWALEVAGVTRAWVFAGELGAGTVVVRIVNDDAEDIIPPGDTVDAVQAHIDALRPVTADVTVEAPSAAALNLTIQLTPATAAVKAAVEAELADLLYREAEPGTTLLLSHINEAIAIAVGETDHVLVSPSADVVYTNSQMPILGTITWA